MVIIDDFGDYDSASERQKRHEASDRKDRFLMAAGARPASAQDYQAWLESHLDHGGKIGSVEQRAFNSSGTYTISRDAELPAGLCGSDSVHVIVPEGITLTTKNRGHCTVYNIADGSGDDFRQSVVYREILPSMIERGYALDQLVPQKDWEGIVSGVLEAKVGNMRKASVADADAILKVLGALDLASEAKRQLGLDPAMQLPAPMQKAADDFKDGLTESYKAFRYKLDPTSQTPGPSLLKPKVNPAKQAKQAMQVAVQAATTGAPEKIVVMPRLKFKGAAQPPSPAPAAAAADTDSAPKKWGFRRLLGKMMP